MINGFPVNGAPVNGAGIYGALHTASALANTRADAVVAEPVRRRRLKGGGSARAIDGHPELSARRDVPAKTFLTRASATLAKGRRERVSEASALARASKSTAKPMAVRGLGAMMAQARGVANNALALVNASYFTITATAQCIASGVVRPSVIRFAKAYFYNPAAAIGRKALLSARRRVAGQGIAAATAPASTWVRLKRMVASGVARATGAVQTSHVIRLVAGLGAATAQAIAANLVSVIVVLRRVFQARALAMPPNMLTWMYSPEPDYRTVFVRNDYSTTRMRTFRKQPAEVLPYDIDFAEWLAPLHGDDIESAQVIVHSAVNGNPADLAINNVFIMVQNPDGTRDVAPVRVKVWLSGGTHGATYKLTVRVDTEGGRRKEVDFRMNVREV